MCSHSQKSITCPQAPLPAHSWTNSNWQGPMVIVSIACITDMAAAGFNMANHTSHMSQASHITHHHRCHRHQLKSEIDRAILAAIHCDTALRWSRLYCTVLYLYYCTAVLYLPGCICNCCTEKLHWEPHILTLDQLTINLADPFWRPLT